ncbi:MAG: RNA polymerase sigma factor [Planctomycetes bacterium]|nr:RNA polymerase sigma factor [Planctomycetota bacterium]
MPDSSISGDAFVRAFEAHGRALSAIAAAWVGRVDVQDLLQEAARVAWQRRSQFIPGSDIRAWFAQIIRHLGANWRRRRSPLQLDSADLVDHRTADAAELDRAFDAEHLGLTDDLARGLAGLSQIARECLLLHVVAGHTVPEISTILGMPESTAQSHVRRARRFLRTALGETPAAPVTEGLPNSEMS